MASVEEIWTGRAGSAETGGKGNEGIQRRYTRCFRVITDSVVYDSLAVMSITGVPRLFDQYVTTLVVDLGARCHSVSARQTDEPRIWEVDAQYSTSPSDIGEKQKEDNKGADGKTPTQKPAEISYGSERYTKVIKRATRIGDTGDIPNAPIASSAGEEFDPPIEIDDTRPTLTITRNEAAFDSSMPSQYCDKLNSDPFFGFAAGQVKCMSITAVTQHDQDQDFWKVTYLFHVRPVDPGWNVKILDAGFWEINQATNKRTLIRARNRPVPAPWPLDAQGHALSEAAVQADSVFFREYRVYNKTAFAPLALP